MNLKARKLHVHVLNVSYTSLTTLAWIHKTAFENISVNCKYYQEYVYS